MELKERKRWGRAPLPDSDRLSVKLAVPVTRRVHDAVKAAADARGTSIGSYLRDIISEALA